MIMFVSCTNDYNDVQFKEIRNVQIGNLTGSVIEITGDCVLYNPNNVTLDLTDADLDLIIEGNRAGKVQQQLKVVMPAASEFVLPLKATMSPKEFYGDKGNNLMQAAVQMLARQEIYIKYDGVIKAGKGWASVPVKVLDSVQVPVRIF